MTAWRFLALFRLSPLRATQSKQASLRKLVRTALNGSHTITRQAR
jgi:hypothetical protein